VSEQVCLIRSSCGWLLKRTVGTAPCLNQLPTSCSSRSTTQHPATTTTPHPTHSSSHHLTLKLRKTLRKRYLYAVQRGTANETKKHPSPQTGRRSHATSSSCLRRSLKHLPQPYPRARTATTASKVAKPRTQGSQRSSFQKSPLHDTILVKDRPPLEDRSLNLAYRHRPSNPNPRPP
jgi:hypothetical protein